MKLGKSLTTHWLGVCLTAGASLWTLAGSAHASLTVTNYGVAAPLPTGMSFINYNFGSPTGNFWGVQMGYNSTTAKSRRIMQAGTTSFDKVCYTRGTDLTDDSAAETGYYYQTDVVNIYYPPNGFQEGAQDGDSNFANFDFDGDKKFETVGQFHFNTGGGGYLIAVAQDNSGAALSISAGKLLIEQGAGTYGLTAVPEPTSVLGTVGLLTSGLLLRRRGRLAR